MKPVTSIPGARRRTATPSHLRQRGRSHNGGTIVPSADDKAVMAGAGTATLELLRQAPGLSVILVPVGGGGLAAGTAVAAKEINRHITVIGVEPRTGADMAASLRAGHRVTLPAVPDTILTGCGIPTLRDCRGRSTRCSSMMWSPSPTTTSRRP